MNSERKNRNGGGADPAGLVEPTDIDKIAALWMARRNAGLSTNEKAELQAWHSADRRHAAALAKADLARTELDWPLHSGAVEKVLAGLEARAYKRWQRRKMAGVALLVALLGGVSWPLQRAVDENAADTQPITMMVSQPQRKMLPDGSIVELKDGANITIDYSSQIRLITLIGGTAHFQVVKNSGSPFIVRASGRHVRAVGTAFTVELDANEMTVLVTEGTVAVGEQVKEQRAASADSHARMVPSELVDAGHSIVFDLSAQRARLPIVRAVSQDELERRAAWRYPRLHFSGAALGEVVALLNRYNRIQLVIADPSLVGLKLSGALRASKVDALVQLLESDHQVKAEWRETEIVLRVAPAPTRNQ